MATKKKALLAAAGASGGAAGGDTDQYFNQTSLLLQADTSNEALEYNALNDASSNSLVLSPNGGVHGTSFSPFNTSWSNYFDGDGDYLSIADSTDFDFGTGDFTWEAWIRTTVNVNFQSVFGQFTTGGNNAWGIHTNSSGTITYFPETNTVYTGATTVTDGEWHHIAVARNGSTIRLFVDGVLDHSATNTSNISETAELRIGSLSSAYTRYFDGNISNLRLVKGTAVYTSNFTPSTSPLTAISGTSLLTCQSNRFVDNSGNDHTITVNGNAAVKSFSPFTETDTTTGSLRFDGSDDWVTVPDSDDFELTGDFTLECWIYRQGNTSTSTSYQAVFGGNGSSQNGWTIYLNSSGDGTIYFFHSSFIATSSSGVISDNQWHHIAVTRSGTDVTIWVDGASVATGTVSGTLNQNTNNVGTRIGYDINANGAFKGHISNVRVVKGTAVYTSAFTPSTSPLTAITNTSLLTAQSRGASRNVGFIDSSPQRHGTTVYGTVGQGSFNPYGDRWSNYFDGSSDYFTIVDDTSLDLGSSDFTLEAWVYKTNSSTAGLFNKRNGSTWSAGDWSLALDYPSGYIGVGSYEDDSSGNTLMMSAAWSGHNSWTHIALSREGNTWRLFVDGTLAQTVTSSISIVDSSVPVTIGRDNFLGGRFYMQGYISNLRLVKGTAVYTSSFTPPTEPLTAISGTSLLTCQSNRFKDNSSNNHTITVNGTPKVTAMSPYLSTAAYDPATVGGSGYFDGTGDKLITSGASIGDFGTGDFTIEAWINANSLSGYNSIIADDTYDSGSTPNAWCFYLDGTSLDGWKGGSSILTGGTLTVGQWHHVAWTRSSGTMYLFLDGQQVATASDSTSFNHGDIIVASNVGNYYFDGYISDLRVVKGTATYTSNFTPPTSPLSADGAVLKLDFANAGIYDGTANNDVATVGNAHIDNATKKYGTGAMYFDGTGDYLLAPDVELGTGDFTIELWAKTDSSQTSYEAFLCIGDFADTTGCEFYVASSRLKLWSNVGYGATTDITSVVSGWSSDAWHHYAFCRSGSTLKAFVDGQECESFTFTNDLYGDLRIGAGYYQGSVFSVYPAGHMDDFRITKGVARYTSSFTPPEAKLPNIGSN